jgi:hypothetical protein
MIHDSTRHIEDRGRLAPMAAKLVGRLAIMVVVRPFPNMGWADSHNLIV